MGEFPQEGLFNSQLQFELIVIISVLIFPTINLREGDDLRLSLFFYHVIYGYRIMYLYFCS